MTASLPLVCLVQSVLLYRVDKGLHSNLIAAIVLLKVVDVEFYSMTFSNVSHREKVPLWVVKGIVVKVEVQIVFEFSDTLNFSKVSRLKLSIKKDCILIDVVNVKGFGRVSKFLRLKVRGDTTALYWIPYKLSDVNLWQNKTSDQ